MLYSRVLVGVDAEEDGRDAIAVARDLAAVGGKVTLAHILVRHPMMGYGAGPLADEEAAAQASEHLERVSERAGIDADVRVSASTSVGRGLHVLTDELDVDLLVVGSTRHGLLGRVLVGDDTTAALDGSACAVVVAPAGYALHPRVMREIGVAYNGSPESQSALAVARGLAGSLGAKVSAFQAVEVPTYASVAGDDLTDSPLATVLADVRQRLAVLEDVDPHVVYGHPGEELSLYSASLDLLVIGSRGYGPVGRFVHGGTTRQLTRTARCPLLIIPRVIADVVVQPTPTLLAGVNGAAILG
jgi:nucleotide-binding universal stress UspA family protein